MIKNLGDNTKMIFGTGDIGVNSGIHKDSSNKKIGIATFYNQEPRTIGDPGDIAAGTTINIDEFPILMEFHAVESIDVLIEALLVAKKLMLEDDI